MTNVLTFKVEVKGLEDKIYRVIEITDSKTMADLVYTILATFQTLAYHLYKLVFNKKVYDSFLGEKEFRPKGAKDARKAYLNTFEFIENDKMEMEYDFGSTNEFVIKYICKRPLEKGNGRHYPYIIEGKGRGIIDDISSFELKEIVDDIDKLGYSKYYYTPGYEMPIKYDYRDYDLKIDNILLKGLIEEIKDGYEQ